MDNIIYLFPLVLDTPLANKTRELLKGFQSSENETILTIIK